MKRDRTSRRRVQFDLPRGVLLATASLVLLLLAGQAVFGAGAVGLGGDDSAQFDRFEQWLRNGWYVPWFELRGGEPDPGTFASPFVYGPVFSVLAHLANAALGNEGLGEVSADAGAYEVRHLLVALIGLAAVVCVGVAVRMLTRDLLAAIWGAAALLAIPVWTGNSMFNVKDIPVASGFTFVTVGLILGLAWARRHSWPSPPRLLSVGALVALGTFIAVGTRSAMWLPFVCSLSAFAALSWLMLRSTGGALRSVAAPAVGLVVALGGVAALYPNAAATPIDWLLGSVSDSSGYEGQQPVGTLTAGEFLSTSDTPARYLPTWLFAGIPVIIFGLAVAGTVIVIHSALRWRSSGRGAEAPSRAQVGGMLLVVLQLVLLPTAAIVAGSSMYSGLRQHLYVLPAVAMLAGIGAAQVLRATRVTGASRTLSWAAALVLALALAVPAVEQTRLYPYNYVYVNPIAGLGGIQGRWETEIQFLSSREAFRRIPPTVEPSCSYWLVPAQGPAPEPMIHSCREYPTFRDEVGDEATARATKGERWVVGRTRADNHPPDYCREHDDVTRPLRTEEVVMAYVLRCTPPRATVRDALSDEPQTANEIAEATELPVATVRRLLGEFIDERRALREGAGKRGE
jgi:hypothetical protein